MAETVDLGSSQEEEEEKQFLVCDHETGQVFDLRIESHLTKLEERPLKEQAKVTADWWKQKRQNNQKLLYAAEEGRIDDLKKLLDRKAMGSLVADVNAKGLDQWTALHFAANEGCYEVVRTLLAEPDIDKEATSSIMRTPLHLAVIRGYTQIVRALIEAGADKNARDFDENTPLHLASEFGNFECIIYLIKEANVDPTHRNKFGYVASDIAQNYQIRQLFENLLPVLTPSEESKCFYGRTAFGGVLRHNDRINSVQKLMHSYQHVNKLMQNQQQNEEALIRRLEEQEAFKKGARKSSGIKNKLEKHEKKWKMKFIKIWKYNEHLEEIIEHKNDERIGPHNFFPIMKLGQGSFG